MRKLVRDKIRFIEPPEPRIRQRFELCKPEEMKKLLIDKLEEEKRELVAALLTLNREYQPPAPDKGAVAKELVDLFEVMREISKRYGLGSERQITVNAEQERQFKGGFVAGVVLVSGRQEMMNTSFKKLYEKKAKNFFLNEQHTTHVTKAQARKERRKSHRPKQEK